MDKLHYVYGHLMDNFFSWMALVDNIVDALRVKIQEMK
jgi:hypothetical protein